MTSNAVGGMSNNASGQIQESWSVPETMVDGITERLRKAIITGAIEACAGRDVTTFQNALIRHYVETEKTVRDGFSLLQNSQTEAGN
jgi:hypothetical protein